MASALGVKSESALGARYAAFVSKVICVPATERFHALDACRAAAMSLGVLLHAAASFVVTPIGWAVRDPSANITADLFIGVIHLFRMPVFFLLSGFFARLIYLRLGIGGFVLHRVQRIVVPLVVALPLLSPALDALWRWGGSQAIPGYVQGSGYSLPRFDMGAAMVSSLAHLWFLYYLAVLLAIVIGIVWMLRHPSVERLTSRVDSRFASAIQRRYLSFVMALPMASVLWFMELPGLPDTPLSVVPQPRLLAYYGMFLAVGWFLHRRRDLVSELGHRLPTGLVIAVMAAVPCAYLAAREVLDHMISPGLRVISLYCGALLTWQLTLLFIGCFVRYLSRPRVWVRWLADASYWCYLVHLPIVVILQILLARVAWPGATKYGVIVCGAMSFCLVTYQAFVRYTFIGTTLNGNRTRFASPQVTAEAGS